MPVLPFHVIVPEVGVTLPEPVPDFITVRVWVVVLLLRLNVAVTDFEEVIDTVHIVELTLSHPVQLVNVEPEAAVAVRYSDVPEPYCAVPALPFHVTVPVLADTVPEPEPAFVTVSVL